MKRFLTKPREILDFLICSIFINSNPKKHGPGKYIPAVLTEEERKILAGLKSDDTKNVRV
jgi:hypothetical protein